MSTFPDGLFQYGGQPVGALWASPWSTARFVDGENGNDNNSGLKPTEAFDTIQAAVTASTRGDVIYIRPQEYTIGSGFTRYLESVTTTIGGVGGASGVDMTNSDISIIGCANTNNPEYGVRWAWTTAAGYNLINPAPALHLENIGFYSEGTTTGGTMNLQNNGTTDTQRGCDGTTIYNCVIKGGLIKAGGGDGLSIQKCRFHAMYDGTYSGGIYAIGSGALNSRRLLILDNIFQTGNSVAGAQAYITVTTYTEVLIARNYFGECAVDAIIGTTSSGLIADNRFWGADEGACITLGSMIACNNLYDTN